MDNNMQRRMESYFDGFDKMIYSQDSIPLEQVIEFTSKQFEEDYKTSYKYSNDNIKSYDSKKVNKILLKNEKFNIAINYIAMLYDYLTSGNTSGISKEVLNEVSEWEIKGRICLYFSVLLYYLLTIQGVVCKDCVKFVQGFYRHEIRKDYPPFYPWAGQHNGLHAWITVQDSIIDISIKQQEYFFDFGEHPFVIGEIPEGLIYMGWEENKDILLLYLVDILSFSKKSLQEWVYLHLKNSLTAFISLHKEIVDSLDKLYDDITGGEKNED